MTRGLRNNNPLNIRYYKATDKPFQGEVKPSRDPSFRQFFTVVDGYRAAFHLLINSYIAKGQDTIEEIIYKWAPPKDNNDTEAYIKTVVKRSGISRTQVIKPTDTDSLIKIVAAMSFQENAPVEPNILSVKAGLEKLLKKKL
jgi:hypothetical protein